MRRPLPHANKSVNTAWHTTPWIVYSGSTEIDRERACGAYEERRTVSCQLRDRVVDDAQCSHTPKPASAQPIVLDGGCTYSWSTTDWAGAGPSCTLDKRQTRDVSCVRDSDRREMPESFCTGTKPPSEQSVEDFSTCTYSWDSGEYGVKPAACTDAKVLERDVWCKRDLDGKRMTGESQCDASQKPAATKTERDVSACTYRWDAPDEFTDPGDSCTLSETHTRPVSCLISLDGKPVDDDKCAGQTRPDATKVVPDYTTCEYKAVDPGEWTWSSTCSATAVRTQVSKCQRSNDGGEIVAASECESRGKALTAQVTEPNYSGCSYEWDYTPFAGTGCGQVVKTRTATCRRTLDGAEVADGLCSGKAKESLTQSTTDYSTCSYDYGAWSSNSWSSQCSANATWTQTRSCIRSDGTAVDASECRTRDKGEPTRSGQQANYAQCSHHWQYSGFAGAGCGATTQTQTATCIRDLDGASVPDAACAGVARDPLTRSVANYDACGFDYGAWGNRTWNTQCSSAATWTETRSCVRSDGAPADAAECQTRGKGDPTRTGTAENYDGCAHQWSYSTYAGAGCGTTTQTRTAWCSRMPSGATVGDSFCAGSAKEPLTRSVTNYDACGYDYGSWSAKSYSSQCSATANWTQTRSCIRSDGAPADASECSSRGKGPATQSGTEANYAQCSYQWSYSAYAGVGCGTNNVPQSRTAWCTRTLDGATVGDSFCAGSAKEPLTRHVTNYDTCGYDYGAWSARSWDNQCAANANWSQSRTCYRSDGVAVAAAECSNRGKGPSTQGGTEANYSQCTYTPSLTQSSCSNGSSVVTNRCVRSDGQIVANSYCNQPDTYAQACTSYSWQADGFGAFGACQADSRQYQYRSVYCQSNTGGSYAPVDDSRCSAAGAKPTNVNSQGCTYASWQQTGWGAYTSSCGPATRYMNYSCIRASDGATIADAECSNRYGAKPVVKDADVYNTSGCTYTPHYGDWGTCQGGTQYRTNTCTRNQTGENVDPATYCGIPASQSQGCQMPVPVVTEATFGNADGYDSYSGPFNRPGDNPPTHYRTTQGVDLGPGNGNYNYEGMSCSYSVTLSYGGQTGSVSGSGSTGASGGCFTNPGTVTLGGRTFRVTSSWSSNGYGTANHQFVIN